MFISFIKRFVTSAIALIVLVFVLSYSYCQYCHFVFGLFLIFIVLSALKEFYQLIEAKGIKPLKEIGMVGAAAYISSLTIGTLDPTWKLLPGMALTLTLLSGFVYFFYHENHALLRLSVTFFGLVYLALPLGVFISINYFFPSGEQDGRWWVFYTIAMTKISDTAAFFCGKAFGKHRLAISISPKKTVEGAIAGLVAAVFISLIMPDISAWVTGKTQIIIPWTDRLVLGVLAGILAPLGDLSESLLKRDAGVKHSSALPGLGGILDMVDSLIFTAPLVYFYLLATFN